MGNKKSSALKSTFEEPGPSTKQKEYDRNEIAMIVCEYWYRTIMNDTSISIENIVNMIIEYYAISEFWKVLSSDFITEEDGTVLKRVKGGDWENCNYGENIIPSIGGYIYEWYFEIVKLDSGYAFIGICDTKCDTTDDSARWIASNQYMYYGYGGRITQNAKTTKGLKYRTGDKIMIRLNTKQGKIEFYRALIETETMEFSGSCQVTQEKDLYYKMATTMYYHGTCVKLIKFDVIKA